jgi:phage-related protein
MATFSYTPSYSASETSKPRAHRFQAGDGYEQRVRFGLRNDPKVWQLTFAERTDSECADILAFLEARGGAESFDWTPPMRMGGNRLLWSEDLYDSTWVKSLSAVTADATTAPDGTLTADKLAESSTASGLHYCSQTFKATNVRLVFSIYLKAAERSQSFIKISNTVNSSVSAYFDLSAGTITTTASSGTDVTSPVAAIASAGDDWYRCSIAATKADYNGHARPYVYIRSTSDSYAGTAGSGIYAWGAQMEIGGSMTAYYPTTTEPSGVRDAIPGKYVCEEWDETMRSPNLSTIQATFRQVFEA